MRRPSLDPPLWSGGPGRCPGRYNGCMALHRFHPAVAAWFAGRFGTPTPIQAEAWPAIAAGADTLIAAPTGSGKTLAAFLAVIDALVSEARAGDLVGRLPEETRVLYVSPLKALSNDIRRNLEEPLAGIGEALESGGHGRFPLRAAVRTGDTPAAERRRMLREPPHILVTTPESLYLLLTSAGGRELLRGVRTVIVDEIHALATTKRGAHLALSLERLAALTGRPIQRIGLSATQRPLEVMARFLTGSRDRLRRILDAGHDRERDLGIVLPDAPLEAVMSAEVWGEVYDRLEALIRTHRTTLVFVNTRRAAERIAKALAERLGEEAVTAHHGSLAREHRLEAEQRLKHGRLRALVATASLELGIDIGEVDLVCQIGSPRAIHVFLQRVGRSGHAVGAVPKGRLFPTTRDELVECAALLDAVEAGELERLRVPPGALDVLAQQIVAEVACRPWEAGALHATFQRAWPYRTLSRARFDAVLEMLAAGFATQRGRRGAWIHWDRVHDRLRPRRGARLAAVLNGGVIPDLFDYDVILQPQGLFVGTLNEDFAFESLPGDIFQLGNASYRILKVELGRVFVEDAHGAPPNIPFWFGEAPGRSDALSAAVSRLRAEVEAGLEASHAGPGAVERALATRFGAEAARQLVAYLAEARAALGRVPTREHIVLERFFDEAGDQHLVIHAPFGSRINRAWGLALRKRFCRKFNFELQAAALEDTLVLSLGSTHSFPLEEVARYLRAATVRGLLIQALLAAPMFPTHWRWNCTTALAIARQRPGGRVPPPLQRMQAEDLMAQVFPDQIACFENLQGDREIPDHPLVEQTLWDCLHEVMDAEGLEHVLTGLESGQIGVSARDLAAPSPLAQEVLAARPYAFLDDGAAEERRTQMARGVRFASPAQAETLARIDPEVLHALRRRIWPRPRDAEELHDALLGLGVATLDEGRGLAEAAGPQTLERLQAEGRVALARSPSAAWWVSAERLALLQAIHAGLALEPPIPALPPVPDSREVALAELVRGRLEHLGPVAAARLAADLAVPVDAVEAALARLESDGSVMRGRFDPAADGEQWCARGLVHRLRRESVRARRRRSLAVSPARFMAFLLEWHGLGALDPPEGPEALAGILERLEGWQASAAAWEAEILPARLPGYRGEWLDVLMQRGRWVWARRGACELQRAASLKQTPIAVLNRRRMRLWIQEGEVAELPGPAQRVYEALQVMGPAFFEDLVQETGLLPMQVEEGLALLAARGLASSDGFAGVRGLLVAPARRRSRHGRRRGSPLEEAGRWWLLPRAAPPATPQLRGERDRAEGLARSLLVRYGCVFRALAEREALPVSWGRLLYALRRMEAREEVFGGRFVEGFSGEQFALPAATRRLAEDGRFSGPVRVPAADPLNLTGLLDPGPRLPAQPGRSVVYRDGVPVAEDDLGALGGAAS